MQFNKMKNHGVSGSRPNKKIDSRPSLGASASVVAMGVMGILANFAVNANGDLQAAKNNVFQNTPENVNPAPISPSGIEMPIEAPTGWKRTFAEDFTMDAALGKFPKSPAYNSHWAAYDGFKDTSKHGTYSTSKVLSVSGGMLDMYIHSEGDIHYVAAPIANRWAGQTYGRFTVRFKSDPISQYKTAWLLWPSSGKWNEGEIDFPEGNLDSHIGAFSHCANVNSPKDNCGKATTGVAYTSWHTATTEWTKGKVVWYLDGVEIGSCTENVPNTPMRWTLQTETQLGSSPASSTEGHVDIDWVTIDSPEPG